MTRRIQLILGLLLSACVDVPDLADEAVVDRPRVLAVVAEPPEANPGQDVNLSLMLAEVSPDATIAWSACGAFFSMVRSTQYGDGPAEQGCSGQGSLPLGNGLTATLPGLVGRGLFEDLELAATILGAELPPDTIEAIRTRVGIPILVEATVQQEGTVVRAIKRVLLSEREEPHSNPPAPWFDIGDMEVEEDPSEPFRCRPASGRTLQVDTQQEVELAPRFEGEAEDWTETYEVIDARGELDQRTERALYSWFITGGSLSGNLSRAPLRNEVWTTPAEPGCHRVFSVVRDGHGGTSACAVPVQVGDGVDCDR